VFFVVVVDVVLKRNIWSDRNVCFTLAADIGFFARMKGVAVVVSNFCVVNRFFFVVFVYVNFVVVVMVVVVVVDVVVVLVVVNGESIVIVTVAASPSLIASALN